MIDAIRSEFRRYKLLAEGAMAQLPDGALTKTTVDGSNSIAVICQHMAGNLQSRFSDFLTSDGEKPWRHRDEEFVPNVHTRAELLQTWSAGWNVLFGALDGLTEPDLARTITIRAQPLTVAEALLRALAHASYHAGQIVFIAKHERGAAWVSLSIPPGQSQTYNASPDRERPPEPGR